MIFYLLVGKTIDFGNFCLIPASHVQRVVHNPNSWNHLASTILHLNVTIRRVRTNRGTRYCGNSKMNLESLVTHGLSSISVHIDTVFVRVLLSTSLLMILTLISAMTVVAIRLFTDLAVPGWATYTTGLLLIIIFQLIIISSAASFGVLSQRSGIRLIPGLEALKYIQSKEIVVDNE